MRQAEISTAPTGLPEDILKWEQSSGFEAQHARRAVADVPKSYTPASRLSCIAAAFNQDLTWFIHWYTETSRLGGSALGALYSEIEGLKTPEEKANDA